MLDRVQWSEHLDQAQIATACMVGYCAPSIRELIPRGKYQSLDALADHCEALPEFAATRVEGYAVPRG